mmetsp:Transcript_34119/g.77297  ORF Transcript_34119/g.77297 Transcript_34119/m.77297 type:complete len:297 (-) Transcript_34119:758-1648(-)
MGACARAGMVPQLSRDLPHNESNPDELPVSDHGGHRAAGNRSGHRRVHCAAGEARLAGRLAPPPTNVCAGGCADGRCADLLSLEPHDFLCRLRGHGEDARASVHHWILHAVPWGAAANTAVRQCHPCHAWGCNHNDHRGRVCAGWVRRRDPVHRCSGVANSRLQACAAIRRGLQVGAVLFRGRLCVCAFAAIGVGYRVVAHRAHQHQVTLGRRWLDAQRPLLLRQPVHWPNRARRNVHAAQPCTRQRHEEGCRHHRRPHLRLSACQPVACVRRGSIRLWGRGVPAGAGGWAVLGPV